MLFKSVSDFLENDCRLDTVECLFGQVCQPDQVGNYRCQNLLDIEGDAGAGQGDTPDAGTALDQSIADTNDAEIITADQGMGAGNDDGVEPTVDASMVPDASVGLDAGVIVDPDAIVVVCGDGIVNGDEGCDDGNTDTEVCAYGDVECTVCAAD